MMLIKERYMCQTMLKLGTEFCLSQARGGYPSQTMDALDRTDRKNTGITDRWTKWKDGGPPF